MVIRRATITNVPALTKIHREVFSGRWNLSEQDMTWLVKHCLTYWIKDIGYISVCSTNGYQRIESLVVIPKYQRKGYGTRLVRHALMKSK